MSPWPTGWLPSPAAALLVLLVAGHILADFLIQTREGARARSRGAGYLAHGAAVFATHLLLLLPLLSPGIAILVLAIALLHIGIDWIKWNLVPARWSRLKAFVLDQTAHVSILVLGWALLVHLGAVPGFRWLSAHQVGIYLIAALLASAFAFNATGGAVIVAGVLDRLSDTDEADAATGPEATGPEATGHDGAGRAIGILERTLTLALILYGEWAAIGLLIAAKSIARFEEIKIRRFAEYYLIGTLASLLVALAVGFVLMEVIFPLAR